MPRIPDADIARLKSSVALTDLVAEAGVTLTGSGHNLIGHCPFHEDKTPSFIVDPVKNVWNCLGACQVGGSNVDFVMRLKGVGFVDACQYLASKAGIALPEKSNVAVTTRPMAEKAAGKLANPVSDDAQGEVLLGQVANYYHQTLMDDPLATATAAHNYLRARKIHHAEMLRHFRLGFADRSLGVRLPDKKRRVGAEVRGRLARVGVLRTSGHEWLSGAITIPLLDTTGLTVGLYGRMITNSIMPTHRYLPGPHRAAFNAVGAVNNDGSIIICEALIDALTLWAHGFRQVTAAYGVNGFTEDHRTLCTQNAVKTVYIAYDNDEAGNSAAATLADELMAAGKSVYRVMISQVDKDVNGLACASDDAAAVLDAAIRGAEFLGGAVRVAVPEQSFLVAEKVAEKRTEPAATKKISETATNEVGTDQRPDHQASALPLVMTDDEPPGITRQPAAPGDKNAQRAARSSLLIADGDDFRATFAQRHYRVRSLLKNADLSALKVGLRVTVGEAFHQDTFDVCQAKQRAAFIAAAAEVTKTDAATLKDDLAALLDAGEMAWLSAKKKQAEKPRHPTMTPEEREAALAFLRDPQLLTRIAEDYAACGLVGEPAPKLVSYLCAISRKLSHPLAVLTMAPSAAGKSSLQDATLALVPEEDSLVLSTLTGQALYYSDTDLRHKVLAIAEEEGASRASYALKLLQSDGKLSLAVPIKDADSGQISTQIKTVHGPVALFLTTTAPQIDDELANRCIVLTVDDSAEHTARVHAAQRERETLDGLRHATAARAIRTKHHCAQRLLDSVAIVNPFARALTFRCDRARTRRDHMKYLSLIRAVTFLHQHQRPLRTTTVEGKSVSYIETTLADITAAHDLAAAVLGRSLDELAPQTRALLVQITALVNARVASEARPRESIRFTRRDVRAYTGWSSDQIDIHMKRLEAMEYLISQRGGQGLSYVYTLQYDGQGSNGEAFVLGLAEVQTLHQRLHAVGSEGATTTSEAVPRGVRGPSVPSENALNHGKNSDDRDDDPMREKKPPQGDVSADTRGRGRSDHASDDQAQRMAVVGDL